MCSKLKKPFKEIAVEPVMCRLWLSGTSLPQTTQHVNSQASDSSEGVENEKSGSKALTSANMSVTLSLKVCQRAEHADKPELSGEERECNPANRGGGDGQLGPRRSLPGVFNPCRRAA